MKRIVAVKLQNKPIAQAMIDNGIARIRERQDRHLPVTGACHWCEAVVDGRTFCGKDCADDYHAEKAARKRNGK